MAAQARDAPVSLSRHCFVAHLAGMTPCTFFFFKTNRLPVSGAQQHFFRAIGQTGGDQLIPGVQGQGDNPARPGIAVGHQIGLLDHALLGRQHDIFVRREIAHPDKCRHTVILADIDHIDDRLALRHLTAHWNLVHFQGGSPAAQHGLWDISLKYKRIGDAFDPSLGFVPRPGVHRAELSYTWQPRPKHPIGPLRIRQCFWENELSYVAGLTGGWQSYEYFMAPVNCRLESGDRFEFNIVPTGERLTEPFDVADGVTIPAGSYHFRRFRLEGGLAAKRKFNAQATWWFGGFYDGWLDQYELSASWKPAPLLIVAFVVTPWTAALRRLDGEKVTTPHSS